MQRLLFDIEGNGLLQATETAPAITRVHCIAVADIDGQERWEFGPNQIPQALELLAKADILVGQNVLRYDFPVLEKLHGFVVPFERKRDLMVISRLKHPNLKETDALNSKSRIKRGLPKIPPEYFGAHTVGAWGFRLGEPKLHEDITDWSEWTAEMQERCVGDVLTSLKWWNYLKPDLMPQGAVELEHEIAHVCELMTQAGWPFDVKAAGVLHAKLVERQDVLLQELQATFGGWWKPGVLFTPKVNNKARGYVVGQPCTKIEWITFNPKSHQHIEKVLRDIGWQPTEFTDSGQAKTDEEILENVAALYPQSSGLVEYLMLSKRLGQLATGKQAWLGKVTEAGKIHGAYNPMGCVTSRAAHFNPNIAQVPANGKPYGPECRALFHVPEGWELLGADMEGLELRGLGHYMARPGEDRRGNPKGDGGEFASAVLEGDPHWTNVLGFGFFPKGTTRDKHDLLHTVFRENGAKRGIYAIVYGCGNYQLGTIILDALRLALKAEPDRARPIYAKFFGTDMAPGKKAIQRAGKVAKDGFLENLPALARLKDDLGELSDKQGWLPGLDKRRVPCRSNHSAVNALVQSCGAILCKRWVTDTHRALLASGLKHGWDGDFVNIAWVHDEQEIACRVGLSEHIGPIIVDCARKSGDPYGFRVRLDSSFKVGRTWADVH